MKQNNKILGIDWLQYSCRFYFEESCDKFGSVQLNGIFCDKKEGRTKDFESIYNIKIADEATGELIDFAVVTTKWNFREKLHENLQILKVFNHIFYMMSFEEIETIVKRVCTIKKIMRIDFFCDFKRFDNIECESFIKKVANNDICIKGGRQTQVILKNKHYESCTFGTRNTPVRCYLYNKTKEIKTSGKEYIYNMHKLNNLLDDEKDVWRLEFSILQPSMVLVDELLESDSFAGLKLANLYDYINDIYLALCERYFTFITNDTRRKQKSVAPTLSQLKSNFKIKHKKYNSKTTKKTDKTVLKSLAKLNDELRTWRIQELPPEAIDYFVKSRQLRRYNEENMIYLID